MSNKFKFKVTKITKDKNTIIKQKNNKVNESIIKKNILKKQAKRNETILHSSNNEWPSQNSPESQEQQYRLVINVLSLPEGVMEILSKRKS